MASLKMAQNGATALKVESWAVGRLVPYQNNARTHSEAQVKQIAASIQRFGFCNPVLVNSRDGILAGHGRLLGAQLLAMEEVPVIVLDHLSESEQRAYILADNKIALNAGWDDAMLASELKALAVEDFDLGTLGFDEAEIEKLIPSTIVEDDPGLLIDRAAELQVKWGTARGQVWEIGRHRLMCGDSTSPEDVAVLFVGGQPPVAIVTDPPYGMNLDTDWSGILGTGKSLGFAKKIKGKAYAPVIGDDKPFDPLPIFELWAVSAAEVFLFGADYYSSRIPGVESGSWMVWDKRKESQSDGFGSEFELIWSKTKHKRRILRHEWFGFLREGEHGEARTHPTQKSVALIADIIEQWCETQILADPYCGSGTTIVAAEKLGRVSYSMEISPPYVAVCLERMSSLGLDPRLAK